MKWVHYTKSQSVAAELVQQIRDDQAKAQTCLLNIISSLQYIARQVCLQEVTTILKGIFFIY